MGGLGPAAAAAAVEASELPRGTCFSGALSKQVLADCGHIPGLYGSPVGTLLSRAGGLKGLYWASAHAPSPSLVGRGPGNSSWTCSCLFIWMLACFVPGSGVKVRASPLLLLASAPSIWAETHRGLAHSRSPPPWNRQGDWRAGRMPAPSGDGLP